MHKVSAGMHYGMPDMTHVIDVAHVPSSLTCYAAYSTTSIKISNMSHSSLKLTVVCSAVCPTDC
jgi:hypothetical protein